VFTLEKIDVMSLSLLYEPTAVHCVMPPDMRTWAHVVHAGEVAAEAGWADALVVNNHYDTDGVASIFALVNPEVGTCAAARASHLYIL
jgi:hypothetical protein